MMCSKWIYTSFCGICTARATLQGYFLPTGLAILAGHGIAGLWTPVVLRSYLYALPAILAGVLLGGLMTKKLTHAAFAKLVYVALALMGAIMLLRELFLTPK